MNKQERTKNLNKCKDVGAADTKKKKKIQQANKTFGQKSKKRDDKKKNEKKRSTVSNLLRIINIPGRKHI
jgi:hypothetical protein